MSVTDKFSIFLKLSNTPSNRLKQLTQSLSEARQKFTDSYQTLKLTLDRSQETLEDKTSYDMTHTLQHSFETLEPGFSFLDSKNEALFSQNGLEAFKISDSKFSHEEKESLDIENFSKELFDYSILRFKLFNCLKISDQLKQRLDEISLQRLDTAYFADSEITPKKISKIQFSKRRQVNLNFETTGK